MLKKRLTKLLAPIVREAVTEALQKIEAARHEEALKAALQQIYTSKGGQLTQEEIQRYMRQ